MRDSRAKVPRWVNGVSGRPAKRKANAEHEQADGNRTQSTEADGDILRRVCHHGKLNGHIGHQEHRKNQQKCAKDFAEEGLRKAADVRRGAKAGQFAIGVFGHFEVLAVKEEYQRASDDSAEHLRDNVTGDFVGREFAGGCHGNGHGRIQVRAAEGLRTKDANEYGKPPSRGDDDPTGVLAFGARQDDVGNNAVAEDDEDGRADEFCEVGVHCYA